ncbi:hypothetical protein VTJ83DRAFT_5350 [Remersonia thermophila]|uniref:DUF1330 domain-containing protein n=1 Tax=Remersonia thermophila TaxID=72144 RepID=A0ABR4D6K8_9PEZI
MVLFDLHLVSLTPGTAPSTLLRALHDEPNAHVVFQARVLRWMVLPTRTSAPRLLGRNTRWDLLVGLRRPDGKEPSSDWIPAPLRAEAGLVAARWTASSGVSAKALEGYAKLNAELYKRAGQAPIPSSSSSSNGSNGSSNAGKASSAVAASSDENDFFLDADSAEWSQWRSSPVGRSARSRPVSMLNLLQFRPGKEAHESYKRYGAEFSRRVGAKYGGHVKVVGRIVPSPPSSSSSSSSSSGSQVGPRDEEIAGEAGADGWHEIAWVHYPSAEHFAAMAASPEYKEVNLQHRVGALKDTFILCCQEVGVDGEWVGEKGVESKL